MFRTKDSQSLAIGALRTIKLVAEYVSALVKNKNASRNKTEEILRHKKTHTPFILHDGPERHHSLQLYKMKGYKDTVHASHVHVHT